MAKHDNTGGLWPNKFKQAGDSKPDFTGEIIIDGVRHKLAAWRTDGTKGKPTVSLVATTVKHVPPSCYEPSLSDIIADPFNDPNKPPPF